jgi:hypothetical protein
MALSQERQLLRCCAQLIDFMQVSTLLLNVQIADSFRSSTAIAISALALASLSIQEVSAGDNRGTLFENKSQ